MILFLFLLKTILCQSQSINTLSVCVDDSGSRYLQGTSWTKEIGGKIQRCECLNGGNGQYSCGYTNEAAFLVIADGPQIHRIALFEGDVYRKDCINNIPGTAVGIAADLNDNKMYFTDVVNGHVGIYVTALDCSSRATRFISDDIYEPNGVAIDWLSKNVYWADAQHGAIFMADQFGRNRVRLISGLHDPRSLAVDPIAGSLVWSDHTDGTINFATMNGMHPYLSEESKFETLYADGIWPNQIVIDPYQENNNTLPDGSQITTNGMIFGLTEESGQ
ncbi:Oidioi.mRNA.OKI2018_I69.PAR.g12362.t1.cds [Oikopleura dioica]|uniref:Oidioi.mRNA.OKI2018_I69.PAR.g12362.t1.cds n=1 Tax=Oikopleura dioica TaxID=34765 RepID=A0ABN7S065_OIKDI|nr:Oidioi.mRNA.OKI2018_I69.PAR.g12362.t1.cds [Oikopleura dioica]